MDWLRKKSFDALENTASDRRLKKTLSWPHLVALGVGAIVGTGIYTLIGVGAGLAGPGVMLSFAIAGVICVCAGLCYAEMATMIPAAGSAYTYSYTVLGETLAWIVGWSLILEYTVVCSAVAVGWAGHAVEFVHAYHWPIAEAFLSGPTVTGKTTAALVHGQFILNLGSEVRCTLGGAVSGCSGHFSGGILNVPAILITLLVAVFLIAGTRESATINIGLVIIKLVALAVFVTLALPGFNGAHFTPFMPNGFSGVANGVKIGVMPAASIIFFAFYGFDAVSTAAEETKNPGRDLTIGIVGSMVLCIVIYMVVATAAIGAVAPALFAKSTAPLVFVLDQLNHSGAAKLVAAAAVIALPTVILAFMYGQSRIFFVMARDGLLPRRLSRVNPKTGTPVLMTVVTAVVASVLAGIFPLDLIAALANAGTLCAFVAVIACVAVMRLREPERPRVFRAPVWPLLVLVGIPGCIWLFTTLSNLTIGLFFVWNALGLLIYILFSRRSSLLAKEAGAG